MPDYQTAEGMATEPYERHVRKLRHALKKIKRLTYTTQVDNEVGRAILFKIKSVTEKALKC